MITTRDAILSDFKEWYLSCQQALVKEYLCVINVPFEARKFHFGSHSISLKENAFKTIYKFKYNGGCSFLMPFSMACRGTMYMKKKWIWNLNKFFNLHQIQDKMNIHCDRIGDIVVPTELLQVLKDQGFTFEFRPKWDGSNVQVFSDGTILYAYTLGSLNTEIKMQRSLPDSPSFNTRFLELLTPEHILKLHANPYHSAIFEMCTYYNHIVTDYNNTQKRDGTIHFLCDIASDGIPRSNLFEDVKRQVYTCDPDKFITSLYSAFDHMCNNEEIFGKNPEGVCLYACKGDETYPISKAKRKEYLNVHKNISLDIGGKRDLCVVQKLHCEGKADDLCEDIQILHIEVFEKYLRKTAETLRHYILQLENTHSDGSKYSKIIKSSNMPKWLCVVLLKLRLKKPFKIPDVYEFLLTTLMASSHHNQTLLEILQAKTSFWFQDLSELVNIRDVTRNNKVVNNDDSIIVFFDFDGTLTDLVIPTSLDCSIETWITKDSSIRQKHETYHNIVNVIMAYKSIGAKVFMLTDRFSYLEESIKTKVKEIFKKDILDRFYGNPGNLSTSNFKASIVQSVSIEFPNAHQIVHLEDEISVLTRGSTSVSGRIPYVPLLCDQGKISVVKGKPKPVIVTMVQGPGSGKTTVLKMLQNSINSLGRICSIISYDNLKIAHPTLSSEECYNTFQKQLKKAEAAGHVILLDVCNNKSDHLKYMAVQNKYKTANTFACSFLKCIQHPTKKTKKTNEPVIIVDPTFNSMCIMNCTSRLNSKKQTSTLTNLKLIPQVCQDKNRGCLQQVVNPHRNVVVFKESNTIQQMYSIMLTNIEPMIHDFTTCANIYFALPIASQFLPTHRQSQHVNTVRFPHVTVCRQLSISDQQRYFGHQYTLLLGDCVQTKKVQVCPVIFTNCSNLVPKHPHVTVSTSVDSTSVEGLNVVTQMNHTMESPIINSETNRYYYNVITTLVPLVKI